jgi:hypothetical protein
MIGHLPKRPDGEDPQSRFMQWVWDWISNQRLGDVAGFKVNRTSRGSFIIPKGGGPGGTGKADVRMFKLVAAHDEVLECNPWDGEEAGESTVYVAKPYKLRIRTDGSTPRAWSDSIAGVTHGFQASAGIDDHNPKRLHTTTPPSESGQIDYQYEIVLPPWSVGDIIYGIGCVTGLTFTEVMEDPEEDVVHTVGYLAISEHRIWGWFHDYS